MLRDVSRDRAAGLTRSAQIGALALASIAGAVLALGLPGLAPPKLEPVAIVETARSLEPAFQGDLPAVMERRGASISRNLAQLGNAPKAPPPPADPNAPAEGDEAVALGAAPPVPPTPAVPEPTLLYLGQIGSSSKPMALLSFDAHQHVLIPGETATSASGLTVKLVSIEPEKIAVEFKGAPRDVPLAPRTGASYTVLSGAGPGASPAPGQPPVGPVQAATVSPFTPPGAHATRGNPTTDNRPAQFHPRPASAAPAHSRGDERAGSPRE